jgi:hypothetical protein
MGNPILAFFDFIGWVIEAFFALVFFLISFIWHHPFLTILLVILWFVGSWIYGSWEAEQIYRQYLERIHPQSTPPEERERQVRDAVDTAIATISEYRPAVKGGDIMSYNAVSRVDSSRTQTEAIMAAFDLLAQGNPSVYSQAPDKASRNDAAVRLAAFSQVQIGKMHAAIISIFAEVLADTLAKQQNITDPQARKRMEKFVADKLDQTAAGLGGTALTTMRVIDNILAEPYRPPCQLSRGSGSGFSESSDGRGEHLAVRSEVSARSTA